MMEMTQESNVSLYGLTMALTTLAVQIPIMIQMEIGVQLKWMLILEILSQDQENGVIVVIIAQKIQVNSNYIPR